MDFIAFKWWADLGNMRKILFRVMNSSNSPPEKKKDFMVSPIQEAVIHGTRYKENYSKYL